MNPDPTSTNIMSTDTTSTDIVYIQKQLDVLSEKHSKDSRSCYLGNKAVGVAIQVFQVSEGKKVYCFPISNTTFKDWEWQRFHYLLESTVIERYPKFVKTLPKWKELFEFTGYCSGQRIGDNWIKGDIIKYTYSDHAMGLHLISWLPVSFFHRATGYEKVGGYDWKIHQNYANHYNLEHGTNY